MMMFILVLLMMSLILFYLLTHPMALGVNILLQTALISLLIGLNLPSFWLSYILFLVFMGGILVLTMYVVSLANNEMMSINFKNFLWSLPIFILMFIYFLPNPFMDFNIAFMNLIKQMNFDPFTMLLSLANLYSSTNFVMMLFLASYLFYMLIIISHIININEGPLRSII